MAALERAAELSAQRRAARHRRPYAFGASIEPPVDVENKPAQSSANSLSGAMAPLSGHRQRQSAPQAAPSSANAAASWAALRGHTGLTGPTGLGSDLVRPSAQLIVLRTEVVKAHAHLVRVRVRVRVGVGVRVRIRVRVRVRVRAPRHHRATPHRIGAPPASVTTAMRTTPAREGMGPTLGAATVALLAGAMEVGAATRVVL